MCRSHHPTPSKSPATGQAKPIFGICLGSQLMGLAAGEGDTFKLNHGLQPQPACGSSTGTQHCFITSQTTAVDTATLPAEWDMLFENLNDSTCRDIKTKPSRSSPPSFTLKRLAGRRIRVPAFDDFFLKRWGGYKQR
jgi:carbamoyl-phosphate synthase small subunit